MFAKFTEAFIKFLPANTVARIIASLVTKALSNINDKEKLAKISDAVSSCGKAVDITGEAVKDCEITEDEVNQVSDAITIAVTKIIEASK